METITPAVTELASELFFPEGPVWRPDGTVLVTELGGACVTAVAPDGTKQTVSRNGGSPNGLAAGPHDALYAANSGGWGVPETMGLRIPPTEIPPHHNGGRLQ